MSQAFAPNFAGVYSAPRGAAADDPARGQHVKHMLLLVVFLGSALAYGGLAILGWVSAQLPLVFEWQPRVIAAGGFVLILTTALCLRAMLPCAALWRVMLVALIVSAILLAMLVAPMLLLVELVPMISPRLYAEALTGGGVLFLELAWLIGARNHWFRRRRGPVRPRQGGVYRR